MKVEFFSRGANLSPTPTKNPLKAIYLRVNGLFINADTSKSELTIFVGHCVGNSLN